ncbi:protein huluwa isoform X2 [Boleophthalmus pectinirostris]|uniref:protein huluwa isoform X2 n=1 Tax=Boleophthalmus pectinirostris TaxID=150288 RepID=UPI00242CEAD8|nr:protein huluwa isoform X2 [Boleophthalmus pectinirostris]
MSQVHQTTPSNLTEGYSVSNLTLVVLLLIPCVVILLLLNCLFLGYKLLILSKKTNRREDTEAMLLQSTQHGVRRLSDVAFPQLPNGRRAYMSLSEPVLPHPVTSSRASSRERPGFDHRIRLLRPDCATGSGSLRAPSTIRATSSAATPRLDQPSGVYGKSAPLLPQQSSDSEAETRVNLVPPNSPMEENEGQLCSSSPYDMRTHLNTAAAVHLFDKMDMECELSNGLSEVSCILTSAVGPGLDSDFGASAGFLTSSLSVSLRILSADSDGLSNSMLTSALEWDYYDPCYVKQNNVPKQKHHRPVMHTKQYWV